MDEKLNQAIDIFVVEMKERLHQKYLEGYTGWENGTSAHQLGQELFF